VEEQYKTSGAAGNRQTFEQYMGFLTTSLLLKLNDNDTYSITTTGRQLLLYITIQSYPAKKAF
jgi:hypothetical protein